ncbi:hypothetical protein C2845_PM05G17750 [Panicum miliaceum]|uniref:F-box domain-containing protein n=1 Tax=Panicum miliaceum TaxID=4540 RepID=A0A3L6T1K0_PANMI|nr:hypothetical protein C2845_PM05G17750 [Panicum miliaceum]
MSLAGDVDRISALPDDLLHLILTFVRDAKAITRTAGLSRWWRRVWIHAQHLHLSDTRLLRSTEPGGQFVCFVDWVLAQRGDADIGSLDIVTSVIAQLALQSEALQELKICFAEDLRVLDVTAPNLRVLKLEHCFGDWSWLDAADHGVREVVRIAAPRLQEIGINPSPLSSRPDLDIHDLTSVRRLSDLPLNMHGQYCAPAAKEVGLWLLEKCPSAEHVGVWLQHSSVADGGAGDVVDLTSEGASAFASVRTMDMTVIADDFPEDHLVPSVFALLLRCPRLRSLDILIIAGPDRVRMSGFTEADEDVDLVRLLFASSDSIRSMTLSLNPKEKVPGIVSLKQMMTDDDDGTAGGDPDRIRALPDELLHLILASRRKRPPPHAKRPSPHAGGSHFQHGCSLAASTLCH